MKFDKVKPFYLAHKVKIYSIYVLFFIFVSWYGTTNNYSYKSFQDCLLSKIQGNAQLLTIANTACDKEILVEFDQMKEDWRHSFNINAALEDSRTPHEIYEYLSSRRIEFLTLRSVNNGLERMLYHDESRVSNALKGLLLGGMTGFSIGLVIELLMMIFKSKKYE